MVKPIDSHNEYIYTNSSNNGAGAVSSSKGYIEIVQQNGEENAGLYGKALSLSSSKKAKPYQMGLRQGNTRIIGTNQVLMNGNGFGYTAIQIGNTVINLPSASSNNNSYNSQHYDENYVGSSRQDRRGDCYFLSTINAIRNTKGGQKLLNNNCKRNNNGSFTVVLPGANLIRQSYARQGLKCEVTGTYTISREAMEKACKSNKYSEGDLKVIAFELAMEAFRAEMYITNKENGNKKFDVTTAEGDNISFNHANEGDILSSGVTWMATFILTGSKSNVYDGGNERYNKVPPYQDGKYGYITREEMARRTGADISIYKGAETQLTYNYTTKEKAIDEMLTKYQGKEDQFAMTFSVKTYNAKTKKYGAHALTVMKITNDTIYVSNPWHPDKIEPIPRNEFIKMIYQYQAVNIPNNDAQQGSSGNSGHISNQTLSNLNNAISSFLRKK